jgi:hypothetical protein
MEGEQDVQGVRQAYYVDLRKTKVGNLQDDAKAS